MLYNAYIRIYWDEPPEMVTTWPAETISNPSVEPSFSSRLTVDPATVLGSQESNHASDILRQGAAAERAVISHQLLDLVRREVGGAAWDVVPRVLREHVGLDTTRRDTVDGDATGTEVGSEGLDHTNDSHLGSVVQDVVLDAKQTSSNGAHENEAAVVLKVLPRRLADEELCTGVEVKDVVVLLLCNLLRLVPRLGAAVAHDNVDLAEVLFGLLEQALNLADLADIGLDADGLGAGAGALNGLDDLIGGGLAVGVVDDDVGAALAELNGAATADTTSSARDESGLAVEGGGWDEDWLLSHGCCVYVELGYCVPAGSVKHVYLQDVTLTGGMGV